MWLKLLLLTLYLIFLFVICRILEAASWYHNDDTLLTSITILQPMALSVKKLKELLDSRGVSYSGVVEKNELVDLVSSSGTVTKEELIDTMFPPKGPGESTQFTCGSHFYEEVEDTKDSAWLVHVIVEDTYPPLLPEKMWEELKLKVGTFGVRSGVFKCSLDKKLCHRKGWSTSRLILSLPRSRKAKQDVILHNHLLPSTTSTVYQWVRKHLASRVTEISSDEELDHWMTHASQAKKSEIRVILFSFLKSCPMFLSALAIKFNGRVKFGIVDVNVLKSYKKFMNSDDLPSYLVVTPEKTFLYGKRRGECYNVKSMEIYLKTFVPEINDVFLWSLLLVNILAAFELFFMYSHFWKHLFLYAICVVKYNCILFLLWLLILALYRLPTMMTFTEITLKFLRFFSGSAISSVLRNDYKCYYSNPFLLLTFSFFASTSGYILKRFKWLQPADEDTIFSLFRPIPNPVRLSMREMDMEIDMELFIERLTVPNFRLQPVISSDYIKNLPMWKYRGWCEADDELEKRKGDIFSSDEENVNRSSFSQQSSVPKAQPFNFNHAREATLSPNLSSQAEDSKSSHVNNDYVPHSNPTHPSLLALNSSEINTNSSKEQDSVRAPPGMLESRDCSICLEHYFYGECLCGLPCGHNFHMNCIMVWLTSDNHCCPICRWPSYKFKNGIPHQHSQ